MWRSRPSNRNGTTGQGRPALISYLLDSEVHTFAFSVAPTPFSRSFPYSCLLYTLSRSVFHSPAMKDVIDDMVNYYLPTVASKDWWPTAWMRLRRARSAVLSCS